MVERVRAAVSEAREISIEWKVNGSDNKWLASRGRPELNAKGEIERYRGIVVDITARKMADIELSKHRNHLEELVKKRTAELDDLYNNAPVGYHSLDAEGRFTRVNTHVMVDSVTIVSSTTPALSPGDGGRDVSTFSQLQRCKSQLGDWVACPSNKTPEGQKIIENLRSQISRLEQRQQSQSGSATDNLQATSATESALSLSSSVSRFSVDAWA